ncbi:hypothetical protein BT67DRAFT_441011 [Trichocladium antarcticum]|uniref:Uncharacterized protein n=1 Tax=Trichocladium antarcticum TaxID=1450529 RepID=A0AAN6ZEW0_9PEZI|nr:hypothetical protein BT67DRAFT_441011 [Trichocladium antarcticum]
MILKQPRCKCILHTRLLCHLPCLVASNAQLAGAATGKFLAPALSQTTNPSAGPLVLCIVRPAATPTPRYRCHGYHPASGPHRSSMGLSPGRIGSGIVGSRFEDCAGARTRATWDIFDGFDAPRPANPQTTWSLVRSRPVPRLLLRFLHLVAWRRFVSYLHPR